ncbi:MAG TPA: CoA pyrophosphatase [Gemmatimonadaceae bacterium]|jgi:8-oxo-dGTP pyrophosphatase MutT (NUDIX family)|nr:CoA pyrophosphatase [Gemmatimonadaceae bacterium]
MSIDVLLERPDLSRLARRLARRRPLTIEAAGNARYAAIALVMRGAAGGEPEMLMIQRAAAEHDPWSGHVACPGGRMEPEDHDLEETAVRETREETGVDIARNGRVLGALDDISPRTPSLPPLVIRPFVAVVRPAVVVTPSDEVAEAFWVPLAAIHAESSWGRGVVPIRGVGEREVDVFRHGDYVVWGLTHRALTQFAELLRP